MDLRDYTSRATHFINRHIQPVDHFLFRSRESTTATPLFIVGPPRAGTTLTLQLMLTILDASHTPRALDYSYGLTQLYHSLRGPRIRAAPDNYTSRYGKISGFDAPSEAYGYWRRWFGNGHNGDHESGAPLSTNDAEMLNSSIASIEHKSGAPLIVKCLYLSLAIHALAAAIPHSSFLVVRRDPIRVAASMLRARRAHAEASWWSVRPRGFELMMRSPLADQVVWQISSVNNRINDEISRLPHERWREISYENLCKSPLQTLTPITDWLSTRGMRLRAPRPHFPENFISSTPEKSEDLAAVLSSNYIDQLIQ